MCLGCDTSKRYARPHVCFTCLILYTRLISDEELETNKHLLPGGAVALIMVKYYAEIQEEVVR
jgi:hypothetical protein